jgi:secreted trypsin-like serine protease
MLLMLKTTVSLFPPIALHSQEEWPLVDQEELTILGYGLTAEDGPVAHVLQEVSVRYHADCRFANYQPGRVEDDVMFCAHREYKAALSIDSCHGDSEGRFKQKDSSGMVQVGLTSWGEGRLVLPIFGKGQ